MTHIDVGPRILRCLKFSMPSMMSWVMSIGLGGVAGDVDDSDGDVNDAVADVVDFDVVRDDASRTTVEDVGDNVCECWAALAGAERRRAPLRDHKCRDEHRVACCAKRAARRCWATARGGDRHGALLSDTKRRLAAMPCEPMRRWRD